LRIRRNIVTPKIWHYVILDEGHIIRNPDAKVTLACKRLKTHHRIILSGTPIQNRLKELWSLFDFIFPGKLGTLPVFDEQFCNPILMGGFNHATPQQVRTAFECASLLRKMVLPHILRRTKEDVKTDMPSKTEQVLFCQLSEHQLEEYRKYLRSREVESIITGSLSNRNVAFKAITHLRKICNHPDLLKFNSSPEDDEDYPLDFGNPDRSGKMRVLEQILKSWKEENRKVLIFSQTRQMLDIIQMFIRNQGYTYLRMDGTTVVKNRGFIIDSFNNDPNVFVFLLTTRTGGIGVTLTGASRVLIFDPDWVNNITCSILLTWVS
jgi:DNA excision repair protein ERCC-6